MNMSDRYRRWKRYRATLRELRSYRDHELNDLGIAPRDIDRLAWQAANDSR